MSCRFFALHFPLLRLLSVSSLSIFSYSLLALLHLLFDSSKLGPTEVLRKWGTKDKTILKWTLIGKADQKFYKFFLNSTLCLLKLKDLIGTREIQLKRPFALIGRTRGSKGTSMEKRKGEKHLLLGSKHMFLIRLTFHSQKWNETIK